MQFFSGKEFTYISHNYLLSKLTRSFMETCITKLFIANRKYRLTCTSDNSALSPSSYTLCFICIGRRNDGERARNVKGRGNALCYIRIIRYDNITYITGRRARANDN